MGPTLLAQPVMLSSVQLQDRLMEAEQDIALLKVALADSNARVEDLIKQVQAIRSMGVETPINPSTSDP